MKRSVQEIEAFAKSLCREAGGNWKKRQKYWIRKAVKTLSWEP